MFPEKRRCCAKGKVLSTELNAWKILSSAMKWRKRVCGHGLENFAGKLTGRNKNREEIS